MNTKNIRRLCLGLYSEMNKLNSHINISLEVPNDYSSQKEQMFLLESEYRKHNNIRTKDKIDIEDTYNWAIKQIDIVAKKNHLKFVRKIDWGRLYEGTDIDVKKCLKFLPKWVIGKIQEKNSNNIFADSKSNLNILIESLESDLKENIYVIEDKIDQIKREAFPIVENIKERKWKNALSKIRLLENHIRDNFFVEDELQFLNAWLKRAKLACDNGLMLQRK